MPNLPRIREVRFTHDFRKAFDRMPDRIQRLAYQKDTIFRANPFHPRLLTHKLKGELKDRWAYSVNRENRIVFRFLDDHTILYLDIGTHEVYK